MCDHITVYIMSNLIGPFIDVFAWFLRLQIFEGKIRKIFLGKIFFPGIYNKSSIVEPQNTTVKSTISTSTAPFTTAWLAKVPYMCPISPTDDVNKAYRYLRCLAVVPFSADKTSETGWC